MNIDLRTIGIVISLVDLMLVVIFLLQYRIAKNYKGPGWWGGGFSATSLAFLAMLFRTSLSHRFISIILANTLLVLGGALIYFGVRRFLGKKVNLNILIVIILLFALVMAWFTYGDDNMRMRTILVSGSLGAISLLTAWLLVRNTTATIRFSAGFTAVFLAIYGFSLLLRSADSLFAFSLNTVIHPGWFAEFGFFVTLITQVMLAFGLVFLVDQHAQGEMIEAKNSLQRVQNQYQIFINSSPDIIYLKDDSLNYLMINNAQADFFGKEETDLLGKSDYQLMPPEAAEQCHLSDRSVLESGQTQVNWENVGDQVYETRKFPVKLISGKMGVGAIIRDYTVARRAEEAFVREQYLMNALMDTQPDHIYFKDLESRFIRINAAHARSFGLQTSGDEVGKSDFDFFTEEHAQTAYADEQAIIKSGQPISKEEKETWSDRPDTWVSSIKLPLLNQEGETIGTFGISRDITDRKRTEAELESKNQQLKKMIAEKDKLFSIIAHDLRSPFNALLGLSEMIADEAEMLTLDEMRKSAGLIRKSANSLNNQLGNLLEWSRIQMSVISVDLVLLNLKQVSEIELDLLSEAAQLKHIRMNNHISEDCQVYADKQMLQSILRNLIANAIKFTKPGGEVALSAKIRHDQEIEIFVSDSGIGMSKDIMDKLFKLDAPIYRRGTEGEPSSGLGLIICKELIEKLGGQIQVESEVDKGTTFFFSLKSNV